ncbi:glycosyltransferase family 4 protein [Roseobacter sp.]|uniref:glycosyltransferase family 4 protein n=1 Tax=Roseobacter sp. TaxID=1907202 RepID=UPI00385B04E9
MTKAVFAIPGDKNRRTGGFIYEARVLRELNVLGCITDHLQLPESFPDPTAADMATALKDLNSIPKNRPIILDGLVFGAIDPEGLEQVRAPVIAMVHHPLGLETGLPGARAVWLLRNEAAALRHVDHVIVPSPETARVLCRDLGADPNRITVAPPGFDRPIVDRQYANPPLILSVGLLAPRKGHDVLLKALAKIDDLPWQGEIVGKTHDREYANDLQAQARALGIDKRVTFTGELEQMALTARFNAATVFALATRYEGYGLVLCEAMMFGLPVITCRTGAVPETVGNAAVLVPPEDPYSLAEALRGVINDPFEAARLSRLSVERSATLPHWQDTAQIFSATIERLSRIQSGCI